MNTQKLNEKQIEDAKKAQARAESDERMNETNRKAALKLRRAMDAARKARKQAAGCY